MGLIKAAIIIGGGAYAIKKLSQRNERKRNQCYNGNRKNYPYQDEPPQTQYRDEPKSNGQDYYYYEPQYNTGEKQLYDQPRQQTQTQVHPGALEFVDRRSPEQQQKQPLYLNNSPHHNKQPAPQAYASDYYAQGPPPPRYNQGSPRLSPRRQGFVEPDELSQSDIQSVQPRRPENGMAGGQALLNNLASLGNGEQKLKSTK